MLTPDCLIESKLSPSTLHVSFLSHSLLDSSLQAQMQAQFWLVDMPLSWLFAVLMH